MSWQNGRVMSVAPTHEPEKCANATRLGMSPENGFVYTAASPVSASHVAFVVGWMLGPIETTY